MAIDKELKRLYKTAIKDDRRMLKSCSSIFKNSFYPKNIKFAYIKVDYFMHDVRYMTGNGERFVLKLLRKAGYKADFSNKKSLRKYFGKTKTEIFWTGGLPDLCCKDKNGKAFFVEIKMMYDSVRFNQLRWAMEYKDILIYYLFVDDNGFSRDLIKTKEEKLMVEKLSKGFEEGSKQKETYAEPIFLGPI